MKTYIIGIDGGGTKTHFAGYDANGKELASITLGSVHIMQKSEAESVELLQEGFNFIKEQFPKDEAYQLYVGLGLGGYGGNATMQEKTDQVCRKAFGDVPFVVFNDGQVALFGAFDGADGILVIAGTGSIAYAKAKDNFTMSGGWGYQIGDEGSAYAVGKMLLKEFSEQADGRKKQTFLYTYMMNKYEFTSPYDIISFVSDTLENKREKLASLSLDVYELAKEKDPAALAIFEQAATDLALLANTLYAQTGITNISYGGSLWNAEQMKQAFKAKLQPALTLVEPVNGPTYGAFVGARDTYLR